MSSFYGYEANLQARLTELRQGDRAYELNSDAILDTLAYDSPDAPEYEHQRILDVGCGLGFLSVKLATWPDAEVVGIDPSRRAVELAKAEHGSVPNLHFYAAGAEDFAEQMEELGEEPFDRAILNMVLHSVDDDTCRAILAGIKDCLVPHGSLTAVLLDQEWLMKKLIENAEANGMERTEGIEWVHGQMRQPSVTLQVGIHGHPQYEHPLSVYNRSLEQYRKMLDTAGYGFEITPVADDGSHEPPTELGFWEFTDHGSGLDLSLHDRHVVVTQAQ